jgi:hypothetical protein
MVKVAGQLLDSRRTIYLASGISLALGLFFTFVWAPHPWTWEGIDQYHELAMALARGEGFRTTDVPWGYAYYVALFYTVFGVKPLLPILGQVLANAAMPFLLFALVKPLAGQRTAALAALIVGVFSFNTVYASTQISDAICSVLFMAAVVCFERGHRWQRWSSFAASGILAGLTPQFRPNLVLLPAVVGGLYLIWMWRRERARIAVAQVALFLALSTLVLVPWVVRNYRVADTFLPSSSHGGIQLWYGSLQVGPYLENYSANPRTAFATPVFDYSSLANKSIIVSATLADCATGPVSLTYWTDRDANPATLAPVRADDRLVEFAIPGQPDPTAVYWRISSPASSTPAAVYFISSDHTGDLDRHGDWLDVFDVVRLASHLAWPAAAPAAPLADMDQDGRVGRTDLDAAVLRLLGNDAPGVPPLRDFIPDAAGAALLFSDGSRLRVPRGFSGRVTDLDVDGRLAGRLLSTRLRLPIAAPPPAGWCPLVETAKVNDVFYRREIQSLGRYTALALDNIRRQPAAFAAAAAYRFVRLFVIRPAGDSGATYQFASAPLAYTSGLVLSLGYLLLFLAGVAVAWRRRPALLPLLVPIAYVPATICFVLTNQRYTVTVQPLMFAFMALALVTFFRWDETD